ncbi:MAG TPA: hypothetical protein VGH49_04650, partial [Xanthobacteraceae bacterium]
MAAAQAAVRVIMGFGASRDLVVPLRLYARRFLADRFAPQTVFPLDVIFADRTARETLRGAPREALREAPREAPTREPGTASG